MLNLKKELVIDFKTDNEKKYTIDPFGLDFQTIHPHGKILELHVDNFAGKDNVINNAKIQGIGAEDFVDSRTIPSQKTN